MSYTNGLDKPSDYFNTILWTGDGNTTRSFTGVGFAPDWVWTKSRNNAANNLLQDIVRGANKMLVLGTTIAEVDQPNHGYITSFDSDGYSWTEGTAGRNNFNASTWTYVGWNWLAGGTASSNTDGSITSTVSANTTAGFSIVGYTGTGANASVGHGLGTAPDCIIVKRREDAGRGWWVYHKSLGATKAIYLHDTSASFTNDWLQDTAPTSTVFTLDNNGDTNGSSKTHIAYCFAEKKGYSKFGSYTGNGNANGTFVYTGFKPAMVIFKNASTTANWGMVDNKRDDDNVVKARLFPNLSDTESSSFDICDFTANGFKLRTTDSQFNSSGHTIIYMAFAENPFVTSTGIPTTAR